MTVHGSTAPWVKEDEREGYYPFEGHPSRSVVLEVGTTREETERAQRQDMRPREGQPGRDRRGKGGMGERKRHIPRRRKREQRKGGKDNVSRTGHDGSSRETRRGRVSFKATQRMFHSSGLSHVERKGRVSRHRRDKVHVTQRNFPCLSLQFTP